MPTRGSPAPEIAKKIVREIDQSWPVPTTYLAGGVDGRIYKTTKPGILIKFVLGSAPQEYTSLQKLQNAKVGMQRIVPKFKRGWGHVFDLNRLSNANQEYVEMWWPFSGEHNKVTVFLMGQAGNANSLTARSYESRFGSQINKEGLKHFMMRAWEEMERRGVVHGDLHAGNVIVSFEPVTGKILGLWFIDFGRAMEFNVGQTGRSKLGTYAFNYVYPSWNVFTRHLRNTPVANLPVFNTSRGGSRVNANMLRTAFGIQVSPSREKSISNLRKNLERVKNVIPKAKSVRKTKSLSPAKRKTPSPRPKSAPAHVSISRQKTPRARSASLKRKRT